MAGNLSTFDISSLGNIGNVGLSANSSGGLNSPVYNAPQPAAPINFGYTAPITQIVNSATTQAAPKVTYDPASFGDPNHPDLSNPYKIDQYNKYKQSQQQSSQQNNQPDINAQIDALFGPVQSLYNQQEDYLKNTQYPTELTGLNNQTKDLQDQLTNQQTQTNNTINSQQNELNKSQQSAYQQAVAAYNALKQQSISRFGGGSSAGQATQELANQQFLKSQGEVQGAYATSMGKLNQARNDLSTFVNQNSLKITRDHDYQVQQLDSALKQKLMEIASQRAQTEQAKAQQKLAVIQQSMQYAQQLNAAKEQALINLDTYKQQLQYQIAAGMSALNNQLSGVNTNPFRTPQQTSPYTQPQQTQPLTTNLQGGNILSGGNPSNDPNNPLQFLA